MRIWISGPPQSGADPHYTYSLGSGGVRGSPFKDALPESYLASTVEEYGDNDDGSEDHVLDGVLEIELVHSTTHHPDYKGPDEGAKDPASSPEEARSPHYHGCDDLQFETGSHYGGRGINPGGLQTASEAGEEPADGINE